MNGSFDVAIVGLGAMGSAAAYHMARRGHRVLGLDRFSPPHSFGSSHGQTRIIREAYSEHPSYVPIVQRAYELWAELEEEADGELLRLTGGLMIGPPDSTVLTGAEHSARRHRLPYERLSAGEVRRRYPALRPAEDTTALLDPRAGVLFPEACIESHVTMAGRLGALLKSEEPVTSWSADGDGVTVVTAAGRYHADTMVLTAGAWTGPLLTDLSLPLTVERQVVFWFEPTANAEYFSPDRCPVHIWADDWEHIFYGFPDMGSGVKIARMHKGETSDPDGVRREVAPEDVEPVRAFLAGFMPDANGAQRGAEVCTFTNTPDGHFIIDRHPLHSQVLIASPCSGHGFKFASAIGEILADLATDGRSRFDLSLFRIGRFAS